MTKILITGAKGRMGQSILTCAQKDPAIEVIGLVDHGDSLDTHLQKGVVIIDFSHHTATPIFAATAVKKGCPMVIGTTGFTDLERNQLVEASQVIPMVLSPNMSVGVNLTFTLTQMASALLKTDFDIEIIEKHHRRKKDSPSGTAAQLLSILAESRKLSDPSAFKHGRVGDVGERTSDEIGVHSIRGGDFVGEHTVLFAGEGETIEITHKASSRDIFARGALLAAKWVSTAKVGLYSMKNVLGLS